MFKQLLKFLQVSWLILVQYFRVVFNYKMSRKFFMDMLHAYKYGVYDRKEEIASVSLEQKKVSICKKKICDLFPSINMSSIYTFNKYFELKYEERILLVSDYELAIINSIAKNISAKNILEFGTYKGGLTYNLWLNTDGMISTIDLKKYPTDQKIEAMFEDKRVQRIVSSSFDLSFDEKFDLIFVDAGHHYEEVKKDTELAMKKLAYNGIILWHDFVEYVPGVYNYLLELSGNMDLYQIENTSLVLVHNTGQFE